DLLFYEIVLAKSNAVLIENGAHFFGIPGSVSKLEGVSNVAGKAFEKARQLYGARSIHLRRQLPEHGCKLGAEWAERTKESSDTPSIVGQSFHVGEVAASL